ncbi:sensor histidine kinase [Pseudohongiella nitratireducens]|uniref:sensor histidine kinase n=1 Tax=Pseudohongiella nitratireducens TaxID=1768907 RepID=UPI0030EC48C0|tara:strand:- start:5793 stop:7124 length:1332 start_codon:yes stop_codon:yes gene_type:complete
MASIANKTISNKVRTVLTVMLLLVTMFTLSYSVIRQLWPGLAVLSGAIVIVLTYRLITRVDQSHERFAQFIRNIAHNDFSTTTALQGDHATRDLLDAQKVLIEKYRQLKAERSAQHEYLSMVIEHVDTALLCFDDSGKVVISNRAARQLLQTAVIINMVAVDRENGKLGEEIRELKPGKSTLVKTEIGGDSMQLLLAAREFRLLGKEHKLVSLQNVQSAVDETEMASWQKLIKVLTHEIMNSMTPIVSLSTHLEKNLGPDDESDIAKSVKSIASRSQGLLSFVNSYRSLSGLPKPTSTEILVSGMLERIETLMQDRLQEINATLLISVTPNDLCVQADTHQVEQILLNLLHNALDAVEKEPVRQVSIECSLDQYQRAVIQISDTGKGIPPSQLPDIFTPFFTTKEKGTGVGLSLSRQLAHQNQATLIARSEVGHGSTFLLTFS